MTSAGRLSAALVLFILISLFLGCGSSSQPISVSLAAARNAIDQAQSTVITATVLHDAKNAGVQWGVSGGGSFSATSSTSATYLAPPSVTNSFVATISATSITDPSKSAIAQIIVNPLPIVTTTTLQAATAGTTYFANIDISGGSAPYNWSITSGALPPGLTLQGGSRGAASIAGEPTGPGSSSFTVTVKDASGATASQALTLTVNPPAPLTITTTSLPAAEVGIAYSQNLQATGGVPAYSWSLTAGSLPAGLTLSSSGTISGTPTTVGTSSFTVKVTDSETPTPNSTTANLSITVNNPPLTITTTSLPQGTVDFAYSSAVAVIGGTKPYTWSISAGALPNGLTLNTSTGQISGTPSKTGAFQFTVSVTDSSTPQQNASAKFTITINAALAITTSSLPSGSVGTAYSTTLAATGGVTPYSWSVSSGSLPAGLSLASSTGIISGTPTTAGTSNFTITVSDAETPADTASASLSIIISTAACPNNANLHGNFAAAMEGWNTDAAAVASASAASFIADGAGNISSGNLDTDDADQGHQSGTFTGTYCMASNNLGTMKLNLGAPYNTTNTFAFTLDAAGINGTIMFYDSTNTKEIGPMRQQNTSDFSTASINGNYAFGMIGVDAAGNNRFAVAGQFNSNGLGTLSGLADGDDLLAGVSSQVTLNASDLTVASNGRGTVTLNFSGGDMNFSLEFAFYVVSSSELLLIETDGPQTGHPLLVGQALEQSSGGFTDASLDGNSILGVQSLANAGTSPSVTGGIINASGNGTSVSFSFDQNAGGTVGTFSGSGAYSVASNGRVTFNGSGLGSNPPVLYLVAKNQGFAVGTDSAVTYGQFYAQSGSDFTDASFNGNFTGGSNRPQDDQVSEEVDAVTANGAGSLTGTSDTNVNGGSPSQGSISDTYTVSSSGRIVVTTSGAQTAILYIVSADQVLVIPVDSGDVNPKISWWIQ